jgi:hypothetical protein
MTAAGLLTIMVAIVNFLREGVGAFEDHLLMYVGYFCLIVILIVVGTLVTERFGRK